MYYINLFFIFAIIGYFTEQGVMILLNQNYNSSLLTGPWTIVYGLATLIIIYIGNRVNKLNYNSFIRFLIFAIVTFFAMTLVEFIAGWSIEATLGIVYWDYSNLPMHFTKYVAVPISLIWTAYSSLVYYVIYPLIKDKIKKIPEWVTSILIFFFVVDIIYSIYKFLVF